MALFSKRSKYGSSSSVKTSIHNRYHYYFIRRDDSRPAAKSSRLVRVRAPFQLDSLDAPSLSKQAQKHTQRWSFQWASLAVAFQKRAVIGYACPLPAAFTSLCLALGAAQRSCLDRSEHSLLRSAARLRAERLHRTEKERERDGGMAERRKTERSKNKQALASRGRTPCCKIYKQPVCAAVGINTQSAIRSIDSSFKVS